MDYGAPVGWRLALKHPERVTGLIVQNGNAYEEGLKDFWDPIKAYWADGSDAHREALHVLVTPEIDEVPIHRRRRRRQPHLARQLGARSGAARSAGQRRHPARSVLRLPHQPAALSAVQAYFREHQPPTLSSGARTTRSSRPTGAHPYKRDLPEVEFHLLDTGHFALEDKARRDGAADPRLPRAQRRQEAVAGRPPQEDATSHWKGFARERREYRFRAMSRSPER